MKKRIFALCSALLLSLTVFAGCGSKPTEESAASEPEATATAAPTAEAESSAAESIAEPTEAPSTEPANVNLLTGLPTLTDGAIGKRPVAVMVNNVDAALPQYGISAADLIFELPVEYDLTRLMAVYGDYTQIPEVCSIRSCRYYYPILAVGFDAIYVNWGMNESVARPTVNSMDIDQYDGDEYGLGDCFGRDKARYESGYAWEHTGVFHGPNFPSVLEKDKVRTDLKEDKTGTAFNFVEMDKNAAPNGEDAQKVRVDFGANYSVFTYDEENHEYLKNFKDSPHMDGISKEQLKFENVIVLETEIKPYPGDEVIKYVDWEGGENAKGYYISEGKMVPITWSKAGMYDPLKFFDANGNELQLNRGKSYIAFTYAGNCKVEG
ncbi:DUF3048 domain-containing protein [Hominenteromicrobium sp.]|uniref:DUF3048 domain-containing protein n=1 Tax=Hominenteromicrobium sp. TaxID=3073581 RepID=UPI003A953D97